MMASVALRISAGWLFLAVVVAQWYAQTVSAYSGSSTSGSASGDSTEPECKAPPYSDPSLIRVNPTDEELQELILEGRCYLACATDHYQVDVIFTEGNFHNVTCMYCEPAPNTKRGWQLHDHVTCDTHAFLWF